jgi:hypothetical protein
MTGIIFLILGLFVLEVWFGITKATLFGKVGMGLLIVFSILFLIFAHKGFMGIDPMTFTILVPFIFLGIGFIMIDLLSRGISKARARRHLGTNKRDS